MLLCQRFVDISLKAHEYVLRDVDRRREYIRCEELDDFIKFQTRIVMEERKDRGSYAY